MKLENLIRLFKPLEDNNSRQIIYSQYIAIPLELKEKYLLQEATNIYNRK